MGRAYAETTGVKDDAQDEVLVCSRLIEFAGAPTEITTAGAATYTAAQILSGLILRDPAGSGRTDVLPTAALLVGAMKRPRVGDIVRCLVINNADQSETITIDAGSGGSITQIAGSRIIPQNTSRELIIRVTEIDATPAYVVYM